MGWAGLATVGDTFHVRNLCSASVSPKESQTDRIHTHVSPPQPTPSSVYTAAEHKICAREWRCMHTSITAQSGVRTPTFLLLGGLTSHTYPHQVGMLRIIRGHMYVRRDRSSRCRPTPSMTQKCGSSVKIRGSLLTAVGWAVATQRHTSYSPQPRKVFRPSCRQALYNPQVEDRSRHRNPTTLVV